MASKKKKNVVRCVSCGAKATGKVYTMDVCENVACHEYVREVVQDAISADKNKK